MNEEFKLKPEQQVAVDAVNKFLDSSEDDIFTLSGVGGAGKTTCIRKALEGRSNVIGATISHSAKFVLAQSLDGIASCLTIATLLGLKVFINNEGEISFVVKERHARSLPLPIESANILVVDECSMIDEETFMRIMAMKNSWTKVIFLGDPYQLPPITGDGDSKTFDYTKAELLNAVRYTGPIVDLGLVIRAEIDKLNEDKTASKNVINNWMTDDLGYESRTSQVDENGSGVIFLNDIDKAVEIAVTQFKENEDPEAMRLIAYKNSSITKVNEVIRAQIYHDEDLMEENEDGEMELMLPEFMPGELVISDGGYSVRDENDRSHSIIFNNQTFKVKSYLEIKNGPAGIPSLAMSLDPHVPVPAGAEVYVMDYENGRYEYWENVNQLKKNAKSNGRQWPNYYNYVGQFAWFNYAYAINSHKGQGRTFRDAIVFENDIFNIQKNTLKQKLQAMYVACTRASRRIYIYNARSRVDQSLVPDFVREELGI